ncbi:MAG: hypothetical protein ACRDQA_16700 [Nocardioidaceae bacterium]
MRRLFRQPGFLVLFVGLVASMLGDSLLLIVLAIWVKELTGSAGAAGLTSSSWRYLLSARPSPACSSTGSGAAPC